jgi:hypothetical protein
MGYVKIKTAGKIPGFPGAIAEAQGSIPLTQCTEAKIEGEGAATLTEGNLLTKNGAFTGHTLDEKSCTILASTDGNTGEFGIVSNTNDALTLDADPGDGTAVSFQLHDAGELEISRPIPELAAIAHAEGYAYTFLNGRFYTDMPEAKFVLACSLLWSPLS